MSEKTPFCIWETSNSLIFNRFAKKHGFRQEFGLHCHMLRQTFSNMQIENKRNIKDVQHLLGHKDAKTTQTPEIPT